MPGLTHFKNIHFDNSDKITIKQPYEDTMLGNYTVCPKEVMLKGYTDKIGSTIEFGGIPVKVVAVRTDDHYIYIEMEKED